MATMTVLYPYDAEKPFDEGYYATKHMPLVQELWGDALTGTSVHHAVAGGEAPPAFATITQLDFSSMEAMQAAMGHPRAAELQADIANFAGVVPSVQISRKA